ncbi:TPA: HNH endonuclease [Serratia marcescens]|uniref:HNH endonuclease n=1 Tax=Serratia marcescens TaxID=615 RepID=UPI001153ADB6|nr:HNH endonuclease [Serratia marcescens]MBH2768710.1 HNH endonuclease [Serratia marcescens]MDP8796866.1 HNH endonuclease [Serratia marcescens]QDI50578.1 restriction endonuclease [Serratia marcescens]
MQFYFHEVGIKGAESAFPRTVYKKIKTEIISNFTSNPESTQKILNKEFSDGFCNAWGVPKGAASIIKKIEIGDIVLLVRTRAKEGDIPILCKIKFILNESSPELSKSLWGDERFPLIFLFESEVISYSWKELVNDLGYSHKFRPNGSIYRVVEERLNVHDGADGYLRKIRKSMYGDNLKNEYLFTEGLRQRKETSFFSRNPRLVSIAKEIHGYRCHVCNFDFEEYYGDIGKGFIECHHLNPLSERNSEEIIQTHLKDVITICSNCHKMIHKRSPPFSIEELKCKIKK